MCASVIPASGQLGLRVLLRAIVESSVSINVFSTVQHQTAFCWMLTDNMPRIGDPIH